MNLTIFGATGGTGRLLVEQALAAGHRVTAFGRNPARLEVQHANLTLAAGDVTDPAAVAAAVQGAEAVLSVLGPVSNKPEFAVTRGTENILAAMRQHGVRRLVLSAGAGVFAAGDQPGPPERIIGLLLRVFARNVHADMVAAVGRVTESELDWTVVRVPRLTNDPYRGNVRVGMAGKGVGVSLGRADLAAFMLAQVSEDGHVGRLPVISN